ncbi:MAG: hypothetical protein Q7R74_01820 [bacterium]|nr:hypothetical protein [bacterium]
MGKETFRFPSEAEAEAVQFELFFPLGPCEAFGCAKDANGTSNGHKVCNKHFHAFDDEENTNGGSSATPWLVIPHDEIKE